jgi:hypothetical protein
MPTFLDDKCDEIRRWFAIGEDVYPDSVVTGWIRMAEEYLSVALRVKYMIQIDTLVIKDARVPLPLDWQETRLVRALPSGGVYRYQTADEFFNTEYPNDPQAPYASRQKKYTVLGVYLFVGNVDCTDGTKIEMTYYQSIPPLTNDLNNWANIYHPTVYTLKILHMAALYAIEDQRAPMWDTEVVRLVNGMNAQHKIDQASGSVLMQVRRKTFG